MMESHATPLTAVVSTTESDPNDANVAMMMESQATPQTDEVSTVKSHAIPQTDEVSTARARHLLARLRVRLDEVCDELEKVAEDDSTNFAALEAEFRTMLVGASGSSGSRRIQAGGISARHLGTTGGAATVAAVGASDYGEVTAAQQWKAAPSTCASSCGCAAAGSAAAAVILQGARAYVSRMAGHARGGEKGPHVPSVRYMAWACAGTFTGTFVLGMLLDWYAGSSQPNTYYYTIMSFGAQAVLVLGVPQAPFAQPWNAIGGNTISAVVGVLVRKAFFHAEPSVGTMVLRASLAVSLSTVAMLATGSVHPPAGATAMAAVLAPASAGINGFHFVVAPILLGSAILDAIAVLFNNLSTNRLRSYPVYWCFWRNFGKRETKPPWSSLSTTSSAPLAAEQSGRAPQAPMPEERSVESRGFKDECNEEPSQWYTRWPQYQAPGTPGAEMVEVTSSLNQNHARKCCAPIEPSYEKDTV